MSGIKGPHEGKATECIQDLKAYKDKNSGPATGTRGLVVIASALEKPGTWVRLPANVGFFILFRCVLSSVLPLRSVGRTNFDKGRHNLKTLIHKTDIY